MKNTFKIRIEVLMPDGETFSVMHTLDEQIMWDPRAREMAAQIAIKEIMRETSMYMDGLKYAPSELTRMKEAVFP